MKTIRRIILYFILIGVILSAGLLSYIYFNKDKIIQAFVSEINNNLQVEVQVAEIQLKAFDHWPYVAVQLRQISVRGNNCAIENRLLSAEEINILVNPLNLLQKDYEIQRLLIENGAIYIYRGQLCNNYEIFKSDEQESGRLKLNNITLRNTGIIYDSQKEKQYYHLRAKSASIGLGILNQEISIAQSGEWDIHEFRAGNSALALPNKADLTFDLTYDQNKRMLSVREFDGAFLNSRWKGETEIYLNNDHASSLTITSGKTKLADLKPVLPDGLLKYLEKYKLSSGMELVFEMNGDISGLKAPSKLTVFSKNSSIYSPEIDKVLELESFELQWEIHSISDWKNSKLSIRKLKGILDGSPVQANLVLTDFSKPHLNLEFHGSQTFENIHKLIAFPVDSIKSGSVDFDITYNGLLTGTRRELLNSSKISGIITLNELDFSLLQPDVKIQKLNGQFAFTQNELEIQALRGYAGKGDFEIRGRIRNLIPFTLLENEKLYVHSALNSNFIDIQDWLSSGESSEPYILKLPEKVIYRLDANINRLKLKRFDARKVSGAVILQNESLTFDSVKMDVAGGHIDINLDLNAQSKERIEWFTRGNMKNVFIDSLFYIFNNFNQDFIQQRHLEGQIDTDFTGFLVSDDKLNFDDSRLMFSFNTLIKNGRLILFEPLSEVSRLTKESDLMNLKFDDIRNEIYIQNRVIYIPKMDVYSNIRTISIEGTHTFDNKIEYHLEIPISGKKTDRDERFGVVEDPKTGKSRLPILIEGTTSDYTVKYDKQVLKENIKTGVKDELQELKDLIRKKRNDEDESLELEEDEYFDFN